METVCHPSYPLNSENASPFGTRTLYLAWPVFCAVTGLPPKTPKIPSEAITITTAIIRVLFISTLPVVGSQTIDAAVKNARRSALMTPQHVHDRPAMRFTNVSVRNNWRRTVRTPMAFPYSRGLDYRAECTARDETEIPRRVSRPRAVYAARDPMLGPRR